MPFLPPNQQRQSTEGKSLVMTHRYVKNKVKVSLSKGREWKQTDAQTDTTGHIWPTIPANGVGKYGFVEKMFVVRRFLHKTLMPAIVRS